MNAATAASGLIATKVRRRPIHALERVLHRLDEAVARNAPPLTRVRAQWGEYKNQLFCLSTTDAPDRAPVGVEPDQYYLTRGELSREHALRRYWQLRLGAHPSLSTSVAVSFASIVRRYVNQNVRLHTHDHRLILDSGIVFGSIALPRPLPRIVRAPDERTVRTLLRNAERNVPVPDFSVALALHESDEYQLRVPHVWACLVVQPEPEFVGAPPSHPPALLHYDLLAPSRFFASGLLAMRPEQELEELRSRRGWAMPPPAVFSDPVRSPAGDGRDRATAQLQRRPAAVDTGDDDDASAPPRPPSAEEQAQLAAIAAEPRFTDELAARALRRPLPEPYYTVDEIQMLGSLSEDALSDLQQGNIASVAGAPLAAYVTSHVQDLLDPHFYQSDEVAPGGGDESSERRSGEQLLQLKRQVDMLVAQHRRGVK